MNHSVFAKSFLENTCDFTLNVSKRVNIVRMTVFINNYRQRPAGKRSKGSAFDKQFCASIVAVDGSLSVALIMFYSLIILPFFTRPLPINTSYKYIPFARFSVFIVIEFMNDLFNTLSEIAL